MTSWGNDITIVVPENDDGNQNPGCIGRLYVNGIEVRCDELDVDINPAELNTVTVKLLAENLRILSAGDLTADPKPIQVSGRRRIVLRNVP